MALKKTSLSNYFVVFLIFVPIVIYCKPKKRNAESLFKQDASSYSIKFSKNDNQNEFRIIDDSFDLKLLDMIGDMRTINTKQKSSEKVKSLLTQDDKILMEEQMREKLIERLKKMYVKTSRSR